MCAKCNTTKDYDDKAFVSSTEFTTMLGHIAGRVLAEDPIHLCDDPEAWDWRAFLRQREARLR